MNISCSAWVDISALSYQTIIEMIQQDIPLRLLNNFHFTPNFMQLSLTLSSLQQINRSQYHDEKTQLIGTPSKCFHCGSSQSHCVHYKTAFSYQPVRGSFSMAPSFQWHQSVTSSIPHTQGRIKRWIYMKWVFLKQHMGKEIVQQLQKSNVCIRSEQQRTHCCFVIERLIQHKTTSVILWVSCKDDDKSENPDYG